MTLQPFTPVNLQDPLGTMNDTVRVKPVKIRHAELDAVSEVQPESVEVWLAHGWTLSDDENSDPASKES